MTRISPLDIDARFADDVPGSAEEDAWLEYEAEREDRRRFQIRREAEKYADLLESRELGKRIHVKDQAAERGTSWGRIDPRRALEAARNTREPEVGRFTQTGTEPAHGVFYRGCVNEIHGESESGKSWLALYAVAQELGAGHTVAYVDYEDDEGSVYRRLALLGVAEDVLLGDQFWYIRPNGPLTEPEKAVFAASTAGADTVVLDGVTEGMSLEGLSPRDEADVAAWHAKVTKDLAHAGKCVIVIDHTPHGGNRTIGSQHKKACISGVSYLAEPVQPIAPGQRGVLRLRVEKDRPGSIRREAAPGARPQWRGDLVVDFSEGRTRPDAALFPASPRDGEAPAVEIEMKPPMAICTAVLSFVTENPGASSSDIQSAIQAGKAKLLRAVKWLVDQGYLRKEQEGRSVAHRVTGLELTAEAFGGDQASG
ncbi:AAA family ATPase [Streptomyces fungicidicus]